jgi:hypothetical protein
MPIASPAAAGRWFFAILGTTYNPYHVICSFLYRPRHDWITMKRPSPALVIACLALFVALGGTGYAAMKLPANSVGSAQIRKNAVTGAKVKDGSLLAQDFRAGQLPAGVKGDKGDKGDQGVQGLPGPTASGFAWGSGVVPGSDLTYVKLASLDSAYGTGVLNLPYDARVILNAAVQVWGNGAAASEVTCQFRKSADGGATWTIISGDTTVDNPGGQTDVSLATTIGLSTTAGSYSFALFCQRNGGTPELKNSRLSAIATAR